jgi:hypothetical protein
MALQLVSHPKSVSSLMDSPGKSLVAVVRPKYYGQVLSLVLIGSSSFQVIQDGKVVEAEDGLSIQPFAEFSLN